MPYSKIEVLNEMTSIAIEAGKLALADLGKHLNSTPKGPYDIQVDADVDIEERIVTQLRKIVPEAAIASEERYRKVSWDDQLVWIIDPLDGTNNYYSAIPYVAISIALREAGRLVLAVVHDPVLQTSFTAHIENGAHQDGRPLQTSGAHKLSRATISLVTNYSIGGRRIGEKLYLHLNNVARRVVTLWAPAADLARVTTGHIDAMVCLNAMYGDVCGGLLILAEAGGIALDLGGAPLDVTTLDPRQEVTFVASSSRDLAHELLDHLSTTEE